MRDLWLGAALVAVGLIAATIGALLLASSSPMDREERRARRHGRHRAPEDVP